MIDFLCGFYRKLLNFLAFVLLAVAAILGYEVFDSFKLAEPVFGIIAGLIVGFICEALVFPPLAILFSIDGRLQDIEKSNRELKKQSDEIINMVGDMRISGKEESPVITEEKLKHSVFLISDYEEGDFDNRDEWISKRMLKLIGDGYRASDAKAQAEAEYTIASIDIGRKAAREAKVAEAKKKSKKNPGVFIFDAHEDEINSFATAKELVDYLEGINITEKHFAEEIMPKLRELRDSETFKTKKYAKAMAVLKEMAK